MILTAIWQCRSSTLSSLCPFAHEPAVRMGGRNGFDGPRQVVNVVQLSGKHSSHGENYCAHHVALQLALIRAKLTLSRARSRAQTPTSVPFSPHLLRPTTRAQARAQAPSSVPFSPPTPYHPPPRPTETPAPYGDPPAEIIHRLLELQDLMR